MWPSLVDNEIVGVIKGQSWFSWAFGVLMGENEFVWGLLIVKALNKINAKLFD